MKYQVSRQLVQSLCEVVGHQPLVGPWYHDGGSMVPPWWVQGADACLVPRRWDSWAQMSPKKVALILFGITRHLLSGTKVRV